MNINKKGTITRTLWAAAFLILATSAAAFAAGVEAPPDYRSVMGLSSRKVIWFIAQMHLYLGAFVLGVPIFAVVIEYVGYKTRDKKYDELAYEFTSLLSVAYATTAAIGGLLLFAFIILYPTFWNFMSGVFKDAMFLYAFLFFAETLFLYIYYYGWHWMSSEKPWPKMVIYTSYAIGAVGVVLSVGILFGMFGTYPGAIQPFFFVLALLAAISFFSVKSLKGFHIWVGIWLNVWGTLIMMVANSWAAYMMSPVGVDLETGKFIGTTFEAVLNPLWVPIGIHRILGNIAFGGFVGGAYAAVKFIGSQTPEERAHYDWMGYVANFVGVCGLIPLPFAGYYLGREVYSNSAVMGNNMMGGDFSWTFIIQAMLVGGLFLTSCYYLWAGMGRIPGAERYRGYVKYLNAFVLVAFAIWLTPHNMPLTGAEISDMGGSQYHPTLKYLGLMPAKNAVVNLIILSTFMSFMLYKRGNMGERVPISQQGRVPKIAIPIVTAACVFIVGQYAVYLYGLDPMEMDLPADRTQYFHTVAYLLFGNCAVVIICGILALKDRGILAQYIYLAYTVFAVVLFLGVYGFVVMERASPFLRNIAVSQFTELISCIIFVVGIDVFLWSGAKTIGKMRWGEIPVRSQYALLTLCILITFNMGLMGFIRSGLRTNWHIFGVLQDTSEWAFTPSNHTMTIMVSWATFLLLTGIVVMFWLSAIGESEHGKEEEVAATTEPVIGG
jgi:cytochrome bd-type quinol oxidase subunit 1